MPSPRFYKVGFYISLATLTAALLAALASSALNGLLGIMMDGAARGGTNMPVGVGGGAMSIRSDKGYGTDPKNGGLPCAVLERGLLHLFGVTEIELDGVTKGPRSTGKKGDSVRTFLRSGWTMEMYTRRRDGSTPDQPAEGMRFRATTTCMQGNMMKDGITISPLVPTSTFYPFGDLDPNNKLNEDGSVRRRYMRYDINDGKNTHCMSMPDGNGDEDMCEHMSMITIEANGKDAQTYNCTSGECILGIQE